MGASLQRDQGSLRSGPGAKISCAWTTGCTISAISGIDTALWDLKGKALGVPVMELLGGACRDEMPAYASGGWANADQIGEQLLGYIEKGFKDRKSTRLNSSHVAISYAVFC